MDSGSWTDVVSQESHADSTSPPSSWVDQVDTKHDTSISSHDDTKAKEAKDDHSHDDTNNTDDNNDHNDKHLSNPSHH